MTFRSDHDAAIVRADALQADVDRARARADRAEHELAEVEHERRQLEVELPATEPAPASATANLWGLLLIAFLVVIIAVFQR